MYLMCFFLNLTVKYFLSKWKRVACATEFLYIKLSRSFAASSIAFGYSACKTGLSGRFRVLLHARDDPRIRRNYC